MMNNQMIKQRMKQIKKIDEQRDTIDIPDLESEESAE